MELKGTKTEKNLMAAYAGESEATNKYRYFASKAKSDGYVQIGNIFEEIAQLFEGVAAIEKEHEERYRKLFQNIEKGIVFSKDGDVVWQC